MTERISKGLATSWRPAMTAELTPDDLADIRWRHQREGEDCADCGQEWPCDAARLLDAYGGLLDEVERLRAFETTIRRITGLPSDDDLIHGAGPEPMGILNTRPTP